MLPCSGLPYSLTNHYCTYVLCPFLRRSCCPPSNFHHGTLSLYSFVLSLSGRCGGGMIHIGNAHHMHIQGIPPSHALSNYLPLYIFRCTLDGGLLGGEGGVHNIVRGSNIIPLSYTHTTHLYNWVIPPPPWTEAGPAAPQLPPYLFKNSGSSSHPDLPLGEGWMVELFVRDGVWLR